MLNTIRVVGLHNCVVKKYYHPAIVLARTNQIYMKNSLRYVMYCRKSTDSEDRQVQSIEDQLRELKREVERRGLNVIETFCESKSAKEPGRPLFNKMMEMVSRGEADGIIVWKLNRLARNPMDGGQIQWSLQQNILKSIITVGREYLPADNVLMIAMELGIANQYILDLSKDVTRGMRTKVEKGWRPGRAPIGYLNDYYGEKGNKVIHVDAERFPLVRKMWDMLLAGHYSVSFILKTATESLGLRTQDGKTVSTNGAFKIFTNQFYCGEFIYNGELHPGKHKQMITKEEFDLAQAILGRKGKPRPKHKRLPFNGTIECTECGGMVVAEEKFKTIKSTGQTKKYLYHHCSHNKRNMDCHQKSITHDDLISQIKFQLESITIPEEFLRWALEILREQQAIEETDRTTILKSQQTNFNACVQRIDNLLSLFISPQNISKDLLTDEEFKAQKLTLMAEKARLERELRNTELRVNDWFELTEKTFNFATYAKYWFDQGDFEQKTQILRSLGQNFKMMDGKLSIQLQKPYLTLKEGLENETLKKARVEPILFGLNETKNSPSETVFATWSGWRESNPHHQFGKLT